MTQAVNTSGKTIEVGMKVMAQTVKFGNVVKGCKGYVTALKEGPKDSFGRVQILARVKKTMNLGTYWYNINNMFELNG